jgi:YkoP-like protein
LYHWGKTVFTKRMLRSGRLGLVGPPAEELRHPWLKRVIFGIDNALRRWQSVVEFTGDLSCILRIRIGRLDRDLMLADGTSARVGERFVDLHLWNEQVPAMPREGASIAWARQMHVSFQQSLAQLARYLAERGDLNDVCVVRCTLMFAGPERDGQMARLLARYGFELVPADNPMGLREHARRFGENILISLIVLARNAAALRRDTLRRGRTRVFMSRRALEQRYAGGLGAAER